MRPNIIMAMLDFYIKTDAPINEIPPLIFKRLLYDRTKQHKPTVVLVSGKSGEGKSHTTLKIIEEMFKSIGIDITPYVKNIVVVNPLEYSPKLNDLLYNKDLRVINALQIDEARAVVGSDKWASFINQTIAHVNAMSRAIKPLMVFIVSQSIKDVDRATRSTLNYEIKVRRKGGEVKATLFKFWIDDHDPETPKLKRKRICGIIRHSGKDTLIYPEFKIKRLPKPIMDEYERIMIEGKKNILDGKLQKLTDEMRKDLEHGTFTRVDQLVNHFKENREELNNWAEYKYNKWRIKKDKYEMLNLTKPMAGELEKRLKEVFENG